MHAKTVHANRVRFPELGQVRPIQPEVPYPNDPTPEAEVPAPSTSSKPAETPVQQSAPATKESIGKDTPQSSGKVQGSDTLSSESSLEPKRGEMVLREVYATLRRPHAAHEATQGVLKAAVTVANWHYYKLGDQAGGRLTVTNRRIYFEPHLLNVQWSSEDIPHEDVTEVLDVSKIDLFVKKIAVRTKAGAEHIFVVRSNNTDDLIALLRQQAKLAQEGGERVSHSGYFNTHPPDTGRKKGIGDVVLDISDGVRFAGTRVGGKLLRDDKQGDSESLTSELERLLRLRSEGVLSEEEFQNAKSRLIGGR